MQRVLTTRQCSAVSTHAADAADAVQSRLSTTAGSIMTALRVKLAKTRQRLPSLPARRATAGFMHPIRSRLPHDLPQCQPHTQQEDAERDAAEAAYKVCSPGRGHVSFTAHKRSPNRPFSWAVCMLSWKFLRGSFNIVTRAQVTGLSRRPTSIAVHNHMRPKVASEPATGWWL